jgi:hypothetical protein
VTETDEKRQVLKRAGGDNLKTALGLFIKKMERKRDSMKVW